MYGVLYAISPELFPAKDRGTGNGLTATATRVFGILVRRFSFPLSTFVVLRFALMTIICPFPGAHHCLVCEPADRRARLDLWGVDHWCRRAYSAPPV